MPSRFTTRRPTHSNLFTLIVLLAACAWLPYQLGCQQSTPTPTAAISAGDQGPSAAKLLENLTTKYQDLASYEDAGELHLKLEDRNGQQQESQPIPLSVAFERPNKIRVHSLQASIVADGQQLRASVESLENQVLVRPCPERLTDKSLFPDPMLADAARGQIDATLPQLVMLLEENPIQKLAGSGTPKKLEDAELHGDKCYRVAVEGPEGTGVFWIDANDGLMRKFEFPSDALRKKFDVAKCSIWAEFSGARAGKSIAPAAFQFAVPEGAKLLKRLFPPGPAPPSPLLGRSPEDFTFVGLDGAPVKREDLKDKVAVLDMWATWCGWCFKGFPNLEKVYQQFKDNDKVVILAVSRDEATITDATLRDAFNAAHVTVPIVRDAQQTSEKVLQVQVLPTMVVLGIDGTVQVFQMGYEPELAETLPKKIDELLGGANLAQQELDRYQEALKAYDAELDKELAHADSGEGPAEIARKSAAEQ